MEQHNKEEFKWPLGAMLIIYISIIALYNHC